MDDLFARIRDQKKLSNGVIRVLREVLQEWYYPDILPDEVPCGDMSSFARGTNSEVAPDLDIIFLNAPCDESAGYKDWTAIGTRALTGKKEGIQTLDELARYDAYLAETIPRVQQALETHFGCSQGAAKLGFVRTWEGYPGVVFNVTLPHPRYGEIAFDIDIDYSSGHYGIEHARRFAIYFQRVVDQFGEGVAVQFVEDIKRLKGESKALARDADGWVDRTKKLPGFVIEGLFAQRLPPYTFSELLAQVAAHRWKAGREPGDHWVGDQTDQIIDAGFTFAALLENMACDNDALTKGAWEILLQIARGALFENP